MTDDPLKALTDSMSEIGRQKEGSMSAGDKVVKEYTDWVNTVPVSAFRKLKKVLADGGAVVRVTEPAQNPPAIGIELRYGDEPTFRYVLRLHPKTGTERAFVMRQATVPNKRYAIEGGSQVEQRSWAFFDDNVPGSRWNHAPEITEIDIINDFQSLLTEHRKRDWSK